MDPSAPAVLTPSQWDYDIGDVPLSFGFGCRCITTIGKCVGTVAWTIAWTLHEIGCAFFELFSCCLCWNTSANPSRPLPMYDRLHLPTKWKYLTNGTAQSTGLKNLGLTCFANASLQLLFQMGGFQERCERKRNETATCISAFNQVFERMRATFTNSELHNTLFHEHCREQGKIVAQEITNEFVALSTTLTAIQEASISIDGKLELEINVLHRSYAVIAKILCFYVAHKTSVQPPADLNPHVVQLEQSIRELHHCIQQLQTITFSEIFLELKRVAINHPPLAPAEPVAKEKRLDEIMSKYFWKIPGFYDRLLSPSQAAQAPQPQSIDTFLDDLTNDRNREGNHQTPLMRTMTWQCLGFCITQFFSENPNTTPYLFGGKRADDTSPGIRAIKTSDPTSERPLMPSGHPAPKRNTFHFGSQHDASEFLTTIIFDRFGINSDYGFHRTHQTLHFPFTATVHDESDHKNIQVEISESAIPPFPVDLSLYEPLAETSIRRLMQDQIESFMRAKHSRQREGLPSIPPEEVKTYVSFAPGQLPAPAIARNPFHDAPERGLLIADHGSNERQAIQNVLSRSIIELTEYESGEPIHAPRQEGTTLHMTQSFAAKFIHLQAGETLPAQIPLSITLYNYDRLTGTAVRTTSDRKVAGVVTEPVTINYYEGDIPTGSTSLIADHWKTARYRPTTFICHYPLSSTSTTSGHYITYRLEEGFIIKYNDSTVSSYPIPPQISPGASPTDIAQYQQKMRDFRAEVLDDIENNVYYVLYDAIEEAPAPEEPAAAT